MQKLKELFELVNKHIGCGDNSCMFEKPKGMATNGGCSCLERGFEKHAMSLLYKEVGNILKENNMEVFVKCRRCDGIGKFVSYKDHPGRTCDECLGSGRVLLE